MLENVAPIREIGLLALLVWLCVWLSRWVPKWVDQSVALREFTLKAQAEEREKDRQSRFDVAARYTESMERLWAAVHLALANQRQHDDARTDKILATMSAVCKYKEDRS